LAVESPLSSIELLGTNPSLKGLFDQDTDAGFIPQETSLSSQEGMGLVAKRAVDILFCVAGLIMISPLLVVIALAVKLTSPGPVIYKSLRIGKHKQPFYMYKFRTMCDNAHAMRAQIAKEENLENGLFKLKKDTRITPIGSFLRKYSLDEFPQLVNVIKGDMSLVGPRPYIPEESVLFKAPYTARFNILPGITGPWQVSGRSDVTFNQMCLLELQYLKSWSIWADLKILLMTIPCVLLKKGAY